jgi:hypothetical protein
MDGTVTVRTLIHANERCSMTVPYFTCWGRALHHCTTVSNHCFNLQHVAERRLRMDVSELDRRLLWMAVWAPVGVWIARR